MTPSSNSSEADRPEVLLVGHGATAGAAFRSLARSCTLVGLVRPDPVGAPDEVVDAARAAGVPVLPAPTLADLAAAVEATRPRAVAISSYDRVLPADLLRRAVFVNVHYSLLPAYRGRANVNWALINGEADAGISIHRVEPGLDSGDLLYQEALAIGGTDTVADLYARLNAVQERELGRAVLRALDGTAGRPQDEGAASWGCARVPDDGEIDWRLPTDAIDRIVRALQPPFPRAFTFLDTVRLEIVAAKPLVPAPRYVGRVPGRVVGRSWRAGWVDVLTADGVLRLASLSRPGEGSQPAAALVTSTRQTLGLSRKQLLDRVLLLERRLEAVESRLCRPDAAAPPSAADRFDGHPRPGVTAGPGSIHKHE